MANQTKYRSAEYFFLKVTSHLRGSLSGSSEKKNRTHVSFNKTLTNYTSQESWSLRRTYIVSDFSF